MKRNRGVKRVPLRKIIHRFTSIETTNTFMKIKLIKNDVIYSRRHIVKVYYQDIQLSINYFKPYKYKYILKMRYLYSIFKKI